MLNKESIKFNFLMNIILTMSSIIYPLITFRYVSRILLPEGTGKVSFATSFISYFTMVSQLGIPTYGIRACAKARDDYDELSRTVHELFFINIVMSAVAYIALLIVILKVPRFHEDRLLYYVMSFSILFNTIGMEWLYKGLEQYTYITVRSVIFKVIALIFLFLFVHQKGDYVIYGGISIFASSASYVLNFFHARKYIKTKWIGGYHLQQHLRAVLIFFAMSCATAIYVHLDAVMLGFMKSDEVVGYYDAAVKIRQVLLSIVTALGAVLLPRVSYYIQKGEKEAFKRVTNKAMNFVILLACPLTIYFILFAREGILFLSGPAYENSIMPMQVIMPTLVLVGITNILGIQVLVPLGREKVVLYSEIAGAVIDCIINALLIPSLGAVGAAIGTLLAEIAVMIVQCLSLRTDIPGIFREIHYYRIAVGIVLAVTLSVWIKALKFNSFMILAISATAFFGTYGLFLLVRQEPIVVETVKLVERICQKIKLIKK